MRRVPYKQASKLIHVHISTIYRWVTDGRLRGYRLAVARYRVRQADVLALVVEVVPERMPESAADRRRGHERAMDDLRRAGLV